MKNTTWLVLLAAAILVLAFPAVVSAQAYSYTTVQTRTSPPAYACYLDGNVTMSSSVSGYSYDVSFGVSYEELAFPTIVFGFYLNKSSVGYKEFANSCRRNKASGEYAYCDIEIELSDSTVLSFGHEGKALPLVQSSGYDDGEATGTIILLLEMDKVRLGEIGLEDDRSKTMRRAVEKFAATTSSTFRSLFTVGRKANRRAVQHSSPMGYARPTHSTTCSIHWPTKPR